VFKFPHLRQPEASGRCQRGKGSRAGRAWPEPGPQMRQARSLARLKTAVLRDDSLVARSR
jgi:hypothetical protein